MRTRLEFFLPKLRRNYVSHLVYVRDFLRISDVNGFVFESRFSLLNTVINSTIQTLFSFIL